MGCDSPLRGWRDVHTGGLTFRRESGIERMEVSCGSCLGCRIDYGSMWAMRATHEASLYEFDRGNSFITLTYRDQWACESLEQVKNKWYVPDDWSLHAEHVTLFLKRLRKMLAPVKVRYFYVGEYGRKCKHGVDLRHFKCEYCFLGRPHYHMCLFGYRPDDLEAYSSDGGITRYTSKIIADKWRYGFVDVGDVNEASAGYAARYAMKKINGAIGDDRYISYDEYGVVTFLAREFARMSTGGICDDCGRRDCVNAPGGLGKRWFRKFHSDVFPLDETPVVGRGVVKKVPRYYDELFKKDFPEAFEEIAAGRKRYRARHAAEYTLERLEAKHKCKKARIELFSKESL